MQRYKKNIIYKQNNKKMTHNNLTPEEKKAAKQRASQIIRCRITTLRGD